MVAWLLQSIKSTFLKNSKGCLIFFFVKTKQWFHEFFANFRALLWKLSHRQTRNWSNQRSEWKWIKERKKKKKKNCGLYHFRHYCDVDDEILGSGNLRNSLKASIQNEIDQQQQQKEKFNCFVDFRLSTVTMDSIFAHGSFDCRRCAGSTRFILPNHNYTLLIFSYSNF